MPEFPPLLSGRDVKALGSAGGQAFASMLVVRKLGTKMAANGNPFLTLELGDRSGSFTCTVFSDSPAFEAIKAAGEGAVIRAEGKIEYYQGRLSPRLGKVSVVEESKLTDPAVVSNLVENSPEDAKKLTAELLAFVAGIGRPELRATVQGVFKELGETFLTAPAAVGMHHAYRHGLLEHTVRMARNAKALSPLYPETDADLVMAGVLLHDTGKALEYEDNEGDVRLA